MRVVGGKPGPDGTLYTYIVWTMPGGPAEKAGLRKGDKVSESISLAGFSEFKIKYKIV